MNSDYIPSDFLVLLVCLFFFDFKGASSSLEDSSPTSEAGWEADRLFPNAGTGASEIAGLCVIGKGKAWGNIFVDGPDAGLRAAATLSRLSAVSLALTRVGRDDVAIWI